MTRFPARARPVTMKFHVLVPLVLSGCLLARPAAAQAPAANSSSTAAKSEDAPVALPTFVVDSSRDHGYFATNTLAGTRTKKATVEFALTELVRRRRAKSMLQRRGAGDLDVQAHGRSSLVGSQRSCRRDHTYVLQPRAG